MVFQGPDSPRCPACGSPFADGALYCPGCGRSTGGDTVRLGRSAVTPHAAARETPLFAAFVLVLAALVVAAALGQWLVSLLLVPVVLTLGAAVATLRWSDVEEPIDRMAQQATDNLWAAARVARVSLASWSRAGRTEATLRSRRRRLRVRQDQLLRQLGEAVYLGDTGRTETARRAALANGAEIEECGRALQALRDRINARVEAERTATAPTETFAAQPVATPPHANVSGGPRR